MKFSTIREYFYKLHNSLYITFLVPLVLFSYLYLEQLPPLPAFVRYQFLINWFLIAAFIFIFIRAIYRLRKRIKAIRQLTGLGRKMEDYASVMIKQYRLMSAGCLLLVLGFWLSADPLFIVFFVISMLFLSLLWPTSIRICNDLHLKGEERKMVLKKQDF